MASILIVDESKPQATVTAQVLAKEGYDVEIVPDGITAKSWLEAAEQPPGLVVLDLGSQKEACLKFYGWLKGHPALKRVPVVVMTADRNGDLPPASGVVFKPYRNKLLIALVTSLCRKSPRAEPEAGTASRWSRYMRGICE
jgi:DNA-binding response OmpR family regulator